jgi:arylsulfatase A-like enzyme
MLTPMNRRHALRTLAGAPIVLRAQPKRTPNVVLFLADDLGSADLGFRGAKDIRTPHIDRLAAEGVHFTQAYSNGPVCSPTRCALLTGQYQQRHGVDGVIYVGERTRGLSPDALLLPEVLKNRGYTSGLFGKWHLGYPKENFPTRQGFDEFIGHLAGNIDYFHHVDRQLNPDLWNREQLFKDPRYFTDLIAAEAASFVDRHRQRPFFLYLPFNAPHDPFQGPGDRPEKPFGEKRDRKTYATMIESMDTAVGRVMERLRAHNLDRDTAVFFLSDNGGVPAVASNAPFRGHKGSLWEGGIRTPLIARMPGAFPAGTAHAMPCAGMDLFPTAAELAGASLPAGHRLDSVSLLPACRGGAAPQRDSLFFHYQSPKQGPQRALLQNGWKYRREATGEDRLYHLAQDQSETRDLAAAQPQRLQQLRIAYEAWLRDVMPA